MVRECERENQSAAAEALVGDTDWTRSLVFSNHTSEEEPQAAAVVLQLLRKSQERERERER